MLLSGRPLYYNAVQISRQCQSQRMMPGKTDSINSVGLENNIMYSLLLAVIYLSFISLGLPDSLLGSAWPSIYKEFGVPVSFAGILSMIIAVNTVISSLQSNRLTKSIGTARTTLISVAMTALAILGFSFSRSFWMLCLWAIPYGLGAGSVDAALNNYVALHYSSKHMSWLHCMWGVGTIIGPYIIGYALSSGHRWNIGYQWIGIVQLTLTGVLMFSLPLWKQNRQAKEHKKLQASAKDTSAVTLRQILKIRGAKEIMVTFFCYCAVEQTTMLWASSYMVLHNGVSAEKAAQFASLFFIGITAGRAINGFLTVKFSDTQMIRAGQALIALGIISMLLPLGDALTITGLILIGTGCAPIYPCLIHATPSHFGAHQSQAVIGVQMASAYIGTCVMPPLFGLIANHISAALLPIYILVILLVMVATHEASIKKHLLY